MRVPLPHLFTRAALSVAASNLIAQPTVDSRVTRLDQLVGLTGDQRTKAIAVFEREDRALANLSTESRPFGTFETRPNSRLQIHDLLTSPQQQIYDRIPTGCGGGPTIPTPKTMLEQLDFGG